MFLQIINLSKLTKSNLKRECVVSQSYIIISFYSSIELINVNFHENPTEVTVKKKEITCLLRNACKRAVMIK